MPPGSVSQLLIDGFSIVLIDLLLAGDNALVIAMAVGALPQTQRRIAVACGAAAAVTLRIGITIAAVQLLNVEFLKLAGGALVIWIAVKVLSDARSRKDKVPARGRLLQAIWLIVVADITMSIDNVLAVAGAAHGSVPLIIFGLGISIPLVVFSSQLIATLMDRYAAIVYLGAALLGRVGCEMIMTDPFVARTLRPSQSEIWFAEIVAIVRQAMSLRLRHRR
jgi:YjbE family integral membrane protein